MSYLCTPCKSSKGARKYSWQASSKFRMGGELSLGVEECSFQLMHTIGYQLLVSSLSISSREARFSNRVGQAHADLINIRCLQWIILVGTHTFCKCKCTIQQGFLYSLSHHPLVLPPELSALLANFSKVQEEILGRRGRNLRWEVNCPMAGIKVSANWGIGGYL